MFESVSTAQSLIPRGEIAKNNKKRQTQNITRLLSFRLAGWQKEAASSRFGQNVPASLSESAESSLAV